MKHVFEVTKILVVLILLTLGVAIASGAAPTGDEDSSGGSGGSTINDGEGASTTGTNDACASSSGAAWYAPTDSAPSGNSNPPVMITGSSQSKDCDLEARDLRARRSLIGDGNLFVFDDVFLGEGSKQVVLGFGANPFARLKLNGQLNVNGPGYVSEQLIVGRQENTFTAQGNTNSANPEALTVQGEARTTGQIKSDLMVNTYSNLQDAKLCADSQGGIVLCSPQSPLTLSISPSDLFDSNACSANDKKYTANATGNVSSYQWSTCTVPGGWYGDGTACPTQLNEGSSNLITKTWPYDPHVSNPQGYDVQVTVTATDNSVSPAATQTATFVDSIGTAPSGC